LRKKKKQNRWIRFGKESRSVEKEETKKTEDVVEEGLPAGEEASPQQGTSAVDDSGTASGTQETQNAPESSEPSESPENPESPESPEEPSDAEKLEKVQADLDKLHEDYDSLVGRFQRLTVEYDNFRKRSQREKEAVYPDAVASTVEKFLQVVDNFERAMACETQDKEYKKGVDLIYSSLMDTLDKLQVVAYAEVGDPFQPEIHNAVMHIEDENFSENVISAVFQKGYKIGDKIVRHAMVQVAN